MTSRHQDNASEQRRASGARSLAGFILALALSMPMTALAAEPPPAKPSPALSDKPAPMISEEKVGARTAPLIELGDPFLGTGRLRDAVELPTGAVWNPSLWVFGNYRAALQAVDDESRKTHSELVHRLDLFANLQLSGTERVLLGVTPFHDDDGYSRYVFSPDAEKGNDSHYGAHVSTLFAEFELAELFPRLDPMDEMGLDIGVAVGRQLIEFQDGFLVNDTIDSIGVVKNNLAIPGTINARFTGLYGWNRIHRGNRVSDGDARLYGLFTSFDLAKTTVDFDAIYIDSSYHPALDHHGDSLHAALSFSQRIGLWSTTARLLGSVSYDGDSAAADDGAVAYLETSTSFPGAPHIFYANGFVGVGNYTAAAIAPTADGPLGRTGLLFAGSGMGDYGNVLDNSGQDTRGIAVGYQQFLGGITRQLTYEVGAVVDVGDHDRGGVGAAVRYSHKLTKRTVFQADAYVVRHEDERGNGFGLRAEVQVNL